MAVEIVIRDQKDQPFKDEFGIVPKAVNGYCRPEGAVYGAWIEACSVSDNASGYIAEISQTDAKRGRDPNIANPSVVCSRLKAKGLRAKIGGAVAKNSTPNQKVVVTMWSNKL